MWLGLPALRAWPPLSPGEPLQSGVVCSHLLDALFWVFAGPALAATLLSVKSGRRFLEYVRESVDGTADLDRAAWPGVALIVPVKGLEPGLADNLRSLAEQDYPNYELLIVCSHSSDPALAVARLTVGNAGRIVIAGEPPADTGEKVHNLLAAVDAIDSRQTILAFADSDGEVPPNWLRKLVAPLEDSSLGATTAYRWHFPEDGGFWALLRSVWDSSVASAMDTRDRSFAWGGGTALRREVFESARIRRFWRGTVSDDYRLTAALQAAGLGIRFVPEAMVPTTGQCTGRDFLAWCVRQLTITRVYRFRMWLLGCLSHIVYCGAQLLCLLQLAQGNLLGLGVLLLIVLPGMAKGGMRGYACLLVFPEREEWLERFGWAYFWLTPVATWIWLYGFLRSGATRRIEWRGRVYELISEESTRQIEMT